MSADKKRGGAEAVDYVKTEQKVEADLAKREAEAKAGGAASGNAKPSGDSPKPHGDKLENAKDAAAKG